MASDRKQYIRAVTKRNRLIENGHFSLPPGEGILAILCSYAGTAYDAEKIEKQELIDLRVFRSEALKLGELASKQGIKTEVILNAKTNDLLDTVGDKEISDITVIGNGNFSSVSLLDGSLDWQDLSTHSSHLKLGRFTQRHCGIFANNLNVPFGTFVVSDLSNVLAARGKMIRPRGLDHPDAKLIQPIFNANSMPTYKDIRVRFDQDS